MTPILNWVGLSLKLAKKIKVKNKSKNKLLILRKTLKIILNKIKSHLLVKANKVLLKVRVVSTLKNKIRKNEINDVILIIFLLWLLII